MNINYFSKNIAAFLTLSIVIWKWEKKSKIIIKKKEIKTNKFSIILLVSIILLNNRKQRFISL